MGYRYPKDRIILSHLFVNSFLRAMVSGEKFGHNYEYLKNMLQILCTEYKMPTSIKVQSLTKGLTLNLLSMIVSGGGTYISMVTLKDIAEEAGVSLMTVSRVINNVTSKVSEEKRKKIIEIIEKRGYMPNSTARSLSSKVSRLIAVIVKGSRNVFSYPYNAIMVGSICRFVQDQGYSPMFYQVDDYRDVTKQLRAWNVDGAIFLGLFDCDMNRLKEDNKIPFVFTDSYSPIRQITNVGIDDHKGGELAARHFIEKGHRRIAFVGDMSHESPVVRHRLQGFQQILSEAGIELNANLILRDPPVDTEVKRVCQCKHPVTAFFCAADITALQLMHMLRTLGMRIPEDCSVIGFDDLSISSISYPALTTIRQDIERKAQLATDILFKQINSPDTPAQNIVMDVQLIERASVMPLK